MFDRSWRWSLPISLIAPTAPCVGSSGVRSSPWELPCHSHARTALQFPQVALNEKENQACHGGEADIDRINPVIRDCCGAQRISPTDCIVCNTSVGHRHDVGSGSNASGVISLTDAPQRLQTSTFRRAQCKDRRTLWSFDPQQRTIEQPLRTDRDGVPSRDFV